jgi:hypothetical protein
MTATTFTTTAAEKGADRSSPHRRNLEGKVFVVPWYPLVDPDPAGSINTTARDMGNWLRFQLGAGTFAGKRLVSPEALLETHTPQFALRLDGGTRASNPETNLMSYGMGWLIHDYRGRLLVSHAGFIDGFRAQITLVPKEKLGFVLLYNLQELRMNLALSNSLVDLLLGFPKKDWNAYIGDLAKKETEEAKVRIKERLEKRHPRAPASHEPEAYTGAFEHPAYGRARITFENVKLVRRLMLRWSTFEWPLEHFHFDTFVARDDNVGNPFVTFIFGADGNAAGIQVSDPLGVVFQKEPDKNK